jgi:hypothetical protein
MFLRVGKMTDVKWKDFGWEAIKKEFSKVGEAGSLSVSVGVQGDEAALTHENSGLTNADLAIIHEFGTSDGRIPARPHWRSAFDANSKKYQKELDDAVRAGLDGKRIEGELLLAGEAYRADVIKLIKTSIDPPLSEATVEHKQGETTTLIDTGQYINSFRAVVVKRKNVPKD